MLNLADTIQANDSNTPTLQPMGFGEILDTIFSLYRRHSLLFLGIIAIHFLGGLVEYVLWHLLPHFFLKSYVMDLVEIPFSIISMGGIIVATATIYLGKRITIRDALRQALYRLWHICVCHFPWSSGFEIPRVGVVYFLVFAMEPDLTSISIPYIFIIFVSAVPFLSYLTMPWTSSIYRLITAMIRPGWMWTRFIPSVLAPFSIYFAVRWTFVTTAVLLEKSSIRGAFEKSWDLTRGFFNKHGGWHVWGMLISFSVISFAIQRILQITVEFILILLKVEGAKADMDTIRGMIMYVPADTDTLFYTLTIWSNQIVNALIFPIWVIGITLVYLNLQIRKEGSAIKFPATESA